MKTIMIPVRYELYTGNQQAVLYVVFASGIRSVIESVQINTGKSLPGLRKFGASIAKRNGVPYEEVT